MMLNSRLTPMVLLMNHSLNNGFDPNNPASEDKAVSVME